MKTERELLLVEIQKAFADVKRGNGVTLHEAEVIDDYGTEEKRKQARKLDTEVSWQDVPEADIESHDILNFLDLEGYRYYIPAYMTFAINNFDKSNSNSIDAAIYTFDITLVPPENQNWTMERYSVFNDE